MNRGLVEFVSVRLPRPMDLTLYLGDPQQMFNLVNFNTWVVSVGNGGTAWETELGSITDLNSDYTSVRGTAMHFVCDELLVRGTTTPDAGWTEAQTATVRRMAQCGIGRPSTWRMKSNFQAIGAGTTYVFELAPWCMRAGIDFIGGGGASATIIELNRGPLGDTAVSPAQPINDKEVYSLTPLTNAVEVSVAGANSQAALIQEFHH